MNKFCQYVEAHIMELINIIRLKYAVSLMLNEGKSISESAFASGFTSASYFTKTFTKYYNERPSDYIKRHKIIIS